MGYAFKTIYCFFSLRNVRINKLFHKNLLDSNIEYWIQSLLGKIFDLPINQYVFASTQNHAWLCKKHYEKKFTKNIQCSKILNKFTKFQFEEYFTNCQTIEFHVFLHSNFYQRLVNTYLNSLKFSKFSRVFEGSSCLRYSNH